MDPPSQQPLDDTLMLDPDSADYSTPNSTTPPAGRDPNGVSKSPNTPLLATDENAMFAKLCPELEERVLQQKVFTWNIKSWRSLDNKVYSPPFSLGGFNWRLLLFPNGNQSENVSVYLQASPVQSDSQTTESSLQDSERLGISEAEQASQLKDWAVCAQFGLVMWNPNDPSVFEEKHVHHRFDPDTVDWGFTSFVDLRRLYFRQGKRTSPLIDNDETNISVFIRIIEDETGVLWHSFTNYDSKKVTGYVGLKNQGATCYLNSLLQSLFFTDSFRRAVYQIPTQDDKPLNNSALALQRLFYLLQSSQHPVGTLELTRSFGWDTADAFTQHDVQELNRVLMDKLEGQMKGTKAENALTDLFVGQMKSYIKCINVDFESSREEDYWDIQLNVKGMKNVLESFKDYVQVETLEGENQYQATGYGLQDAKKGVIFRTFPSVLHLQLKRFEYDFLRDTMVKINDRYEFPLEIDLTEFLDKDADHSESCVYSLHGVLVHSGDLNAGHYYALLKPELDGHWFKFDDDRVTRATMTEVLEDNFGGDLHHNNSNTNGTTQPQPQTQPDFNNRTNLARYLKRHSNAYMLVYIRRSRANKVLAPVTEEDVPQYIPQRLAEDIKFEEEKRKEREEQHLYLTVKVLTLDNFRAHDSIDLCNWDGDKATAVAMGPIKNYLSFRLLKNETGLQLRGTVAKELGVQDDPRRVRFWMMMNRRNRTIRPDVLLNDEVLAYSLEDLRERVSSKFPEVRLYAEVISEKQEQQEQQKQDSENSNRILIFLKKYDIHNHTLHGYDQVIVDQNDKISTLLPKINESMGWLADKPLKLFEEIKRDMVEPLNTKSSFQQSELQTGDIIVFQEDLPEEEIKEKIPDYQDARSYYDFLANRVLVNFRPRDSETGSLPDGGEEFELWLSKKDTYPTIANKLAEHLHCNPANLRITTANINGYPKAVIKRDSTQTLGAMFHFIYGSHQAHIMLYEILDVSLEEMDHLKMLKVTLLTEGHSHERVYEVLVPKDGTIESLEEAVKTKAQLATSVKLKFWVAVTNRIYRTLSDDIPVAEFSDNVPLVAEIASPDDEKLGPDDMLVQVFHFQRDPSRGHGIPFVFYLRPHEVLSETKHRLQKRLGLKDIVFDKVRLAIIHKQAQHQPEYIEDNDAVLYDMVSPTDILGLDHPDRTIKKGFGMERAIFIK